MGIGTLVGVRMQPNDLAALERMDLKSRAEPESSPSNPPPGRDGAEGEEVKIVNAVRIVAALLAALCWFMSARTKLTRVRAGLDRQSDTIG